MKEYFLYIEQIAELIINNYSEEKQEKLYKYLINKGFEKRLTFESVNNIFKREFKDKADELCVILEKLHSQTPCECENTMLQSIALFFNTSIGKEGASKIAETLLKCEMQN